MKSRVGTKKRSVRHVILVLALTALANKVVAQLPPSETGAESQVIDISADGIEAAVLTDETLWLKLSPAGQDQFKATLGAIVEIHVLGHRAVTAVVIHENKPGRLVVKDPSEELKSEIEQNLNSRKLLYTK